jgi:hypothetical protein
MANREERQIGRAKNATLTFLEQKLSIPKIYIDTQWRGIDGHLVDVDVLAIDRDGVGDVHAVLLFRSDFDDDKLEMNPPPHLLPRFANLPVHFKYFGVIDTSSERHAAPRQFTPEILERTFSPDGIGRIGVLRIYVPQDGEIQTRIEIKPERFRAAVAKLADEYVQHHEADWEIRA